MTTGARELKDPREPLEEPPGDHEAVIALRRCLEPRWGPVVRIHRSSFGGLTSFPLEVLTVDLGGGRQVRVLLKDLGASRLPKDGIEARRERELRVYRELLATAGLGTAECYGAVWEQSRGRFWLLLEFVDGVELRSLRFEAWVKAAAWLGRPHGRFARRGAELEACGFLIRHDAGFFRAKAERALEAVARFAAPWERRVAAVLRRYDPAVAIMTSLPWTLVHGSFRPQNILLQGQDGAGRVLAVDWELAALGAPLLDFAFLADGFRPREFELLWEAYSAEAAPQGLALPGRQELRTAVDCFRLHKTLKSLGDSVSMKFGEGTVLKLIGAAEDLAGSLFPGGSSSIAGRTAGPDLSAWSRLLPGRIEPELLERFSGDSGKREIYRIAGAGHGGAPVIAKLCLPEAAAAERTMYERVLPNLPLTSPHYYGSVEAAEGKYWILLEDVGGEKFSPLVDEHRRLAARWLGVLHARGSTLEPRPQLPDRGPAHYLTCLRSGRDRILGSLRNPALSAEDAGFLESVLGQCDAVESAWPRLEEFAATLPATLVHGDFRPKNAYVRAEAGGSRLLPFDWETAGWGIAAVDLAPARRLPLSPLVDLEAYEETVREQRPGTDAATIRRQSRLGVVFRRLAAIAWAGESLASRWPEKAVACLRVYRAELEEVLRDPPWTG